MPSSCRMPESFRPSQDLPAKTLSAGLPSRSHELSEQEGTSAIIWPSQQFPDLKDDNNPGPQRVGVSPTITLLTPVPTSLELTRAAHSHTQSHDGRDPEALKEAVICPRSHSYKIVRSGVPNARPAPPLQGSGPLRRAHGPAGAEPPTRAARCRLHYQRDKPPSPPATSQPSGLEQPGRRCVPGDTGAAPSPTYANTPALCNKAAGPRVAVTPLSARGRPHLPMHSVSLAPGEPTGAVTELPALHYLTCFCRKSK